MIDKIRQQTRKMLLMAAVTLTVCCSAATTHAQSGFQGTVALPYEVHWGKAVLGPGSYVLTISGGQANPVVIVRDAKTLRPLAMERVDIREGNERGSSAMLIRARGTQLVVHSLRIAELGETFVYDPALARASAQEERESARARSVPVLEAKNK